jgi:hypothetical protein
MMGWIRLSGVTSDMEAEYFRGLDDLSVETNHTIDLDGEIVSIRARVMGGFEVWYGDDRFFTDTPREASLLFLALGGELWQKVEDGDSIVIPVDFGRKSL